MRLVTSIFEHNCRWCYVVLQFADWSPVYDRRGGLLRKLNIPDAKSVTDGTQIMLVESERDGRVRSALLQFGLRAERRRGFRRSGLERCRKGLALSRAATEHQTLDALAVGSTLHSKVP
jgi:hypothetical protein